MSRLWIYSYKQGSASARALAKASGGVHIRNKGGVFKPRKWKTLVNWGSTSLPEQYMVCNVLNTPDAVTIACDKLLAFQAMEQWGASIPPFTTDQEVAQSWLEDGDSVVQRALLRSNSGKGIRIVETGQELDSVPLYTKYIKKKSEWRVHIYMLDVMLVQQKVKRADVPPDDINWKIRNHGNGFIFQQNGINPPLCVMHEACRAIAALSLHFGAVDVVYNEKEAKAYVLEVNTAPGLDGSTPELYAMYMNRRNVL